MDKDNEYKWTGYLAIVSMVISFIIIQDILENDFLSMGAFLVPLLGMIPGLLHYKLAKGKPESYKKKLCFIFSGLLFLLMVVFVLITKEV